MEVDVPPKRRWTYRLLGDTFQNTVLFTVVLQLFSCALGIVPICSYKSHYSLSGPEQRQFCHWSQQRTYFCLRSQFPIHGGFYIEVLSHGQSPKEALNTVTHHFQEIFYLTLEVSTSYCVGSSWGWFKVNMDFICFMKTWAPKKLKYFMDSWW